jgi:hypothetical protein
MCVCWEAGQHAFHIEPDRRLGRWTGARRASQAVAGLLVIPPIRLAMWASDEFTAIAVQSVTRARRSRRTGEGQPDLDETSANWAPTDPIEAQFARDTVSQS